MGALVIPAASSSGDPADESGQEASDITNQADETEQEYKEEKKKKKKKKKNKKKKTEAQQEDGVDTQKRKMGQLHYTAAQILARVQRDKDPWTLSLPSIGTVQHEVGTCKPC